MANFIISQLFRFDRNTRSVDLSDNKISKIDQFPEELNQMQTLDISHNEIKFIEYDAFDNLGKVTKFFINFWKFFFESYRNP